MKLVTIVGLKRSGKDTVADFILNKSNAIKYQLAGPIKDALHWAFKYSCNNSVNSLKLTEEEWDGQGYDREKPLPINNDDVVTIMKSSISYLNDYGFKDKSDSPKVKEAIDSVVLNNKDAWSCRRLMQTLGTDIIVNQFDRMYWVKLFANNYLDEIGKDQEYKNLFVVPDVRQTHEISTFRAMGATIIHVVRPETEFSSQDLHITEQGLPAEKGDFVITNDGSLEELYEKINKVLYVGQN